MEAPKVSDVRMSHWQSISSVNRNIYPAHSLYDDLMWRCSISSWSRTDCRDRGPLNARDSTSTYAIKAAYLSHDATSRICYLEQPLTSISCT